MTSCFKGNELAYFMNALQTFIPLAQIKINPEKILSIKRDELLPLLSEHLKFNYYADHVIQAQSQLLKEINPQLNRELSETITQLIQKLSKSDRLFKPRRFNRLQLWLGKDIEHDQVQLNYLHDLEYLLEQALRQSQRLSHEVQLSKHKLETFQKLRQEMAHYVVAAQEFLKESPDFMQLQPFDHFNDRLSQKINLLNTVQSNHDMVMTQMQFTEQLSVTLLDRFNEAYQVLIPAWHYHLSQIVKENSMESLQKLDRSRENLLNTLQKSLANMKV